MNRRLKVNLRLMMAKKGIRSMTELERQSGVSRQVLDRLDKDKSRRLDYETIETLCQFFGCDVGELLTLEEDDENNET